MLIQLQLQLSCLGCQAPLFLPKAVEASNYLRGRERREVREEAGNGRLGKAAVAHRCLGKGRGQPGTSDFSLPGFPFTRHSQSPPSGRCMQVPLAVYGGGRAICNVGRWAAPGLARKGGHQEKLCNEQLLFTLTGINERGELRSDASGKGFSRVSLH